jgi:hypothetical protein
LKLMSCHHDVAARFQYGGRGGREGVRVREGGFARTGRDRVDEGEVREDEKGG